MAVTEKSFHKQTFAGQAYYFCSAHCKAKFDASPSQFASAAPAAETAAPVAAGSVYTCPMHPEIR